MSDHSGGAGFSHSSPSTEKLASVSKVLNKSSVPKDGESVSDTRESFAAVTSRLLEPAIKKNVLEVILEKDTRGSYNVSDTECARFLAKLGLDMRPGYQIEGVQICPNGRGVIFVTLKKEVDISKFCRYDIIDITSTGIRSIIVKPAGKREVVINMRGIHPNTSDNVVVDYMKNFGKLVSNKVVYGVYTDGPLRGMKNGDRSLKMELLPNINLGSYHVLDGCKVSLKYPGQLQTCARCLKISRECKGNGVARKCEAEGGLKRNFMEYITTLWNEIGYSPHSENSDLEDIESGSVDQQVGGQFTPQKVVSSPDKFVGISIKNFPRDVDHAEFVDLLIDAGLPEEKLDLIKIGYNGTISIRGLNNELCLNLIQYIHGKKYLSKTIFCNGIVPMTPEKNCNQPAGNSSDVLGSYPDQGLNQTSNGANSDQTTEHVQVVDNAFDVPTVISPLASPTWPSFDAEDLARRHSLSLLNRTPPPGSLAADLLGSNLPRMSESIMSSIRDIKESLSDFNSCISDNTDGSGTESRDSFKDFSAVKKRKRKKSPTQNGALKKTDTKVTPGKEPTK